MRKQEVIAAAAGLVLWAALGVFIFSPYGKNTRIARFLAPSSVTDTASISNLFGR